MNKIMNTFLFALVASLAHYVLFINGDDKVLNILNVDKGGKNEDNALNKMETSEELNLLRKHLNENNMEEALKIIESMKGEQDYTDGDAEKGNKKDNVNNYEENKDAGKESLLSDIPDTFNIANFSEMMKFYSYIQKVLNSKSESSEKKMVRSFLRKSIQSIKKNEKEDNKRTVEDIINNTEGHDEMLNKLAEIMKIDKEKLKEEEVKSNLNKILIGILKFIDYTNKSNVLEELMDEIEVEEIEEGEEGKEPGAKTGTGGKKKLQVNLNNSKTHLQMLQKASDFMGLDITEEKLKELTANNDWYQKYVNQILNYASQYDDEL